MSILDSYVENSQPVITVASVYPKSDKSVLEDIKAEIQDYFNHNAVIVPDHYGDIIDIIDSHINRKERK